MSKRLTENKAINMLNKVWKDELSKYGIDHYYWRRCRLEWRYVPNVSDCNGRIAIGGTRLNRCKRIPFEHKDGYKCFVNCDRWNIAICIINSGTGEYIHALYGLLNRWN